MTALPVAIDFECAIPGDPRGKGSVRVLGGHGVKDSQTRAYMRRATAVLKAAWSDHRPLGGPLYVEWEIDLARPDWLPEGDRVAATTKPDISNVLKGLEDCLTQAGVIGDDKLIADTRARKFYASSWGEPGVLVRISRMEDLAAEFRPKPRRGGAA